MQFWNKFYGTFKILRKSYIKNVSEGLITVLLTDV